MTDIRACVLGCRNAEGYPFRAAPGLLTCHRCSDHLRTVLDELEYTYAQVTEIDEMMPGGHGRTGVRTPPGPRSPAVDGILVHTDPRSAGNDEPAALAAVAGFARLVREDRTADVPLDQLRATVPVGRVTMARELGTLRFNWDWIMGQEWVTDFAAEMRGVLNALRTITRQQDKVTRVGKCPVKIAAIELPDGSRLELDCGASLRLRPGQDEIRCRNCGETWPRSRWHEIGDPWTDYSYLAHIWEIPAATLRWWSREDHWRSVKIGRRAVILRADALNSYTRRRGTLPLGEAS